MSVNSVKNLQEVFVGPTVGAAALTRTASVQFTDPNGANYIKDGEILVLTSTGAVYASGSHSYANSPWIQIVQRNGNEITMSAKIHGSKVNSYSYANGVAGTEQILTIGSNGTTGALDTSGIADFKMVITSNHDDMQWSEQKNKFPTLITKAVVGTSGLILASNIVKNVMKAYLNGAVNYTAVMVNAGTSVAMTATGGLTMAVNHGSPVVTVTEAPTNAGFGVGSVLRISTTGGANPTAVTLPVYTVKEVNGLVITLDQPFAGPTAPAIGKADIGVFTVVSANWGVRFVGKPLTYSTDFFKFLRTNFTVGLSGFGTTPVSRTQAASIGQGDGRAVAELESFAKGFQGALNRQTVPVLTIKSQANAGMGTAVANTTYGDSFMTHYLPSASANFVNGQLYKAITIGHFSSNSQVVTSSVEMPQTVTLFLSDITGSQNTTASTGILTALDDWMGSIPSAPAALAGGFTA